MPARRQRAGLGFAISDDAGDDEVRVVECSDLLVFTGGIGERSDAVRREILSGLGHLGLGDGRALLPTCAVRVVATNENVVIARHVRSVLFDN